MKFFRHFRCLLMMWIDSFAENFLFMCLFALFTIFGCFMLNGLEKYNQAMHTYKSFGFDQAVLYTHDYIDDDNEQYIETIKTLNNNPRVKMIQSSEAQTDYATDKDSNVEFIISVYEDFQLERIGLSLQKGRFPSTNSNEILLTANMMDDYQIDDTISLQTLDYHAYLEACKNTDGHTPIHDFDYMIDYTVTVVGFISDDSLVLRCGSLGSYAGSNTYVDDIFATPYGICLEEQKMSANNTKYAFAIANHLEYDNQYSSDLSASLFIYPKDGVSQDDLFQSLPVEIRRNCLTFDMIEEDYNDKYGQSIRLYSETAICFLISMFSFFVSCYALAIRKRKQELVNYYLYGCSWGKAVLMASLTYIPGTILGSIIGIRFSSPVLNFFSNSSDQIHPVYYFITLTIALFIAATVVIPFFIITIKQSPIELQRGNEHEGC